MAVLIPRAFLFGGADLEVLPNVKVRHPKVADILDLHGGLMCEDYYWSYVSLLLADPYDHMVYLDDNGIDYETVTSFDVFVLRWNSAEKDYIANKAYYDERGYSPADMFRDALAFFFGEGRQYETVTVNGQVLIADLNEGAHWAINKNAFLLAAEFVRSINCVTSEGHINPATPFAKKVLIEDMRAEQKKQRLKKVEDERPHQIADAIASVFAGGAGTITPDNYRSVGIYHLLTTAHSIQRQMMVQALMQGMYSGMMKADKITDKDLSWV